MRFKVLELEGDRIKAIDHFMAPTAHRAFFAAGLPTTHAM